MHHHRQRLTDPDLLRLLMKWAPDGPITVRRLADITGISKSRISDLLQGGPYPTIPPEVADRMKEALAYHGRLFLPEPSTSMDMDKKGDHREPE